MEAQGEESQSTKDSLQKHKHCKISGATISKKENGRNAALFCKKNLLKTPKNASWPRSIEVSQSNNGKTTAKTVFMTASVIFYVGGLEHGEKYGFYFCPLTYHVNSIPTYTLAKTCIIRGQWP